MARTASRPRSGRSRSAGAQSVGRRRQGPTTTQRTIYWLTRVDTAGLAKVLHSLIAAVWLIAGRGIPLMDDLVRTTGVLAFVFIGLFAMAGVLVWRHQLSLPLAYPKWVAASVPLFLVVEGFLAFLQPSMKVGSVDLAFATAGGSLGDFLTSSMVGIAVWMLALVAFTVIVWPQQVRVTMERTPGAMATAWSWHIPHKIWAALLALVDFAFPTKAPPDESPMRTAPDWLPEDEEFDDVEPEVLPAGLTRTEEPEIPDERLKQAQLPVNWWATEESAEEPDKPAAKAKLTDWRMPPMDVLQNAAPTDESAKPDNALRSTLIVETLASFGVDARVAAYHEGPVVTQFDIEPGWEVKYKTVQERDRDGKLLYDKDGKPKTRHEEVSRTRVRVNQITNLSNDLALALAAPSLRIEAPVPGRSVVGIEVPNSAASVVTMRSVIETPAFQRLAQKTKLGMPLG